MNCDDAFDRMTMGTAASDLELLQHLETCPRCRDMQATLSPAIHWLSEVSGDQESDQLATLLSDDSVRLAERTALRLALLSDGSRGRWWRRTAFRPWMIMVSAGVVCCLALLLPGLEKTRGSANSGTLQGPAATVCVWKMSGGKDASTNSAQQIIATCVACHLPASP